MMIFHMGLMNWQWLYIIEALPAIALGLLTLKVLTDRPEEARWLDSGERVWLVTTLEAEREESRRLAGLSEAKGGALWAVVRDPRVLALTLVYVGSSAGLYVLGLWSPLILNQFGYSAMTIGWLNSAPSFVAVAFMVVWARHSDRTLERAWHVAIPCLMAFVGFMWAGEAQSGLAVVACADAGEYWRERNEGAGVGDAEYVPDRSRRGGGDRADQRDGQPGWICGAVADWAAERQMGELCAGVVLHGLDVCDGGGGGGGVGAADGEGGEGVDQWGNALASLSEKD